MRRLFARIRALLCRFLKQAPQPQVGRYGIPEEAYWRPPAEPHRSFLKPRPGWIETRREPGDDYGPNAGLF